jgi:predicted signal transduction protein with EAL and GGDEF domain
MGGDEFAVLQTELKTNDDAEKLADEIRLLIKGPILIDGEEAILKASIGISIYPVDGSDMNDLIRYSDLAMYKAKSGGGDQFGFYAADMSVRASNAATLDDELRRAVSGGEFVLYYQPQFRINNGQLIGAEALIRWKKRDGTLVLPAAFLPRAEQNGLILAINEWVFQTAFDQAAAWRRQGLPKFRVSVNCSPLQFVRKSLPLFVTQVLNRSGLDPTLIDLELTENILLQDVEQVAVQLQHLRQLGVFDPEQIAIMVAAYDRLCGSLHLESSRYAAANELVALRVIEMAKTGDRDPASIHDRAILELRPKAD